MFGIGRRRQARLAAVWEHALAAGGQDSPSWIGPWGEGRCLGRVVGHRQRARSGTKAWVRWVADDQTTAAWFWNAWPAVGTWVLATGQNGHGPHHSERVFYVPAGGFEVIPSGALRAWDRRRRREPVRQ